MNDIYYGGFWVSNQYNDNCVQLSKALFFMEHLNLFQEKCILPYFVSN